MTWTRPYCDTANPNKAAHCDHCGAPRKQHNEFSQVSGIAPGTYSTPPSSFGTVVFGGHPY